jgi:N utilization substance protein A
MSTGRRCPNAALPGSRYCGLDSHQALANQPTDEIAPEADDEEPVPSVVADAGAEAVTAPVEVPAEDALDVEAS